MRNSDLVSTIRKLWKNWKKQVDVLIPDRYANPLSTLHMSMLGIKDLSVGQTPPTNRYPVSDPCFGKNDSVIRDAMSCVKWSVEVKFTIFTNKVDTIVQKVSELQELIPEAIRNWICLWSNGVKSSWKILNRLYWGTTWYLVTTTIIETGHSKC